ncbi:ferroxidase fet3 [Cladochytrium tenue]|nr:ferroxidase fet3 [Cladochytrium tenue]
MSSSSLSASATSSILSATAATSAAAATHTPTTVKVEWAIGYTSANPDGLYERTDVIGVNGKWPIDAVWAYEGDTLELTIVNSLKEATSIHSHGLFQNGTNEYDGVSGVTQCPVPTGDSFVYTIPLNQAGTYWMHGHNLGHYVDGLRAPLVIRKVNETVQYDNEYVVSVSDYYYSNHATLLSSFLALSNPAGNEPVPDAVLINESHNATFAFEAGKTYRLRFVAMAAIAMNYVWIDGHNMTIIEIDGVDVKPYEVQSFMIAPAQRYSVLVTAKNDTSLNYQIHTYMDPTVFDQPPDYITITNATIVYNSASPLAPVDDMPAVSVMDVDLAREITPVTPQGIYEVDNSLYMQVIFEVLTDGTNHGTFNDKTYTRPKVPSLLTALSVGSQYISDADAYGPSTNPYVLQHLKGTEIVIDNTDSGSHPFHLHGHTFQIVDINDERSYDPTNVSYIESPMRRDTVTVPGGGYAVIRFVNDNPGVWLFHCHIEWHLQAGLAATMIEAPELISVGGVVGGQLSSVWSDQCTAQGLVASGNAAGNTGTDLSGYAYSPTVPVTGTTSLFWGSLVACGISAAIGVLSVIYYASPDKI